MNKSINLFFVIFNLLTLLSIGSLCAQTSAIVNGPGWKRVAYSTSPASRGFGKVSIYTTGGVVQPQYVDLFWFKDYSVNTGLSVETNSTFASYWTDARVTFSSDTVYLEVNFTREISGNLMIKSSPEGWNIATTYSGVLPNAANATIGRTCKIARRSIGDQFVIGLNGNVGIGTNSPKEMLSVNGNIRAKEIKVEATNWPDYVFYENYRPIPLDKLRKFIDANKHLPDVPNSKVVQEEGYSLIEMDKTLLRKIEELTLYILEKDAQIELLQKNIDSLINKEHK